MIVWARRLRWPIAAVEFAVGLVLSCWSYFTIEDERKP